MPVSEPVMQLAAMVRSRLRVWLHEHCQSIYALLGLGRLAQLYSLWDPCMPCN